MSYVNPIQMPDDWHPRNPPPQSACEQCPTQCYDCPRGDGKIGHRHHARMSPQYRAMQYFVVGTLHFYRDDIAADVRARMEADPAAKIEWFMKYHRDLIERNQSGVHEPVRL